MAIWSYFIAVLVGALAVVIAFYMLWHKDPIASAFAGLTSSLIVLSGGLASQSIEFRAVIPRNEILGFPFEVTEFYVTGTPMALWITAYVSIAMLLAWFARLIVLDRARAR